MRFRKRPVEIEAVQWTGENWDEIAQFARGDRFTVTRTASGRELNIATLEGVMVASPMDYLIRGVRGELYPCKPDIFCQTYDRVV